MRSIGVDAVEIERVSEAVARHGERFLARVFTDAEREVAEASGRARSQFYAGRFAAKEAVLKAFGTGFAQGLAFRDVEVLRGPLGEPVVTLHGAARARAESMGVARVLLSISHTRRDAYAVAALE